MTTGTELGPEGAELNPMGTIAAIITSVIFLFMFYRAVESEWPESYSILSTSSSYWSSHSLLHYVGFRILPVLVVTTFATVVAESAALSSWKIALGVPLVHWSSTSGRKILNGLRSATRPNNYYPTVIVAVALLLGYLAAAGVAWLLRVRADPIIPSIDEITSGLWTGLAAGVVAAFLTDSRVSGSPDSYEIVSAAIREITPEQRLWCERHGSSSGTDGEILLSIMLVEQLNRPHWFRSFENLAARVLRRKGTYGLMQVRSEGPVSDEDSIAIAASQHLPGIRVPRDEYGNTDITSLRTIFSTYNPDENYVDMCIEVFEMLNWQNQHG